MLWFQMDIPEMPVWKVEISGTLKGIEICLSEEVNKKRKNRTMFAVLKSCTDSLKHSVALQWRARGTRLAER